MSKSYLCGWSFLSLALKLRVIFFRMGYQEEPAPVAIATCTPTLKH
ncbi:MAG: hypothetical protein HEQ35_30965 [Gloeotrichia echinulata IR180]|jgi:hypothetical protein|nr:hypothetical protein [Gloeotrichia echinulata DEX184]